MGSNQIQLKCEITMQFNRNIGIVTVKVQIRKCLFLRIFLFFPFLAEKDVKTINNMILTNKWHVKKHPFAGQNTKETIQKTLYLKSSHSLQWYHCLLILPKCFWCQTSLSVKIIYFYLYLESCWRPKIK